MRNFYSCIHLLTLSVFIAVIQKSWTVDIKATDNLLWDRAQNQNNGPHWKTPDGESDISPSSSIFLHNPKQVDERISNIIAENVLHFGHNVGLELAALDPQASNSEIFSPLSIMSALSLLMLGAKGKSYQELKQLLGLDSDSELIQDPSKYHEEFGLMLKDLQHSNVNEGGVNKRPNANWRITPIKTAPVRSTSRNQSRAEHIIKVVNGLFAKSGYTLNLDYSQVIKSIYGSEITELDFQGKSREARDHINDWVNKATFGKIPQIIKGNIEKSTNVILASALYFKAFWDTSFFPKSTYEENFYPDGIHGPPIRVQMMATGGVFPFYDAKEYDCRIIGLPYKGNETTMYVIQPNNSSRQRLRELQHVLNAHKINEMIDRMQRKTTVMVFPKMHFTRSMTMKSILQNMDVNDVFLNSYSDLSLIAGRPQTSYLEAPNQIAPAQIAPVQIEPIQIDQIHIVERKQSVSFDSINRKMPVYQKPEIYDRFNEPALIFSSRFGETEQSINDTKSATHNKTIKTTAMPTTTEIPLPTVDTKSSNKREKRQVPNFYSDPIKEALKNLESNRFKVDAHRADLFVDDIIHKVDFNVDEQGTEAAAATLTYLHRSGTDIVFRGETPFLIVIRHDPTKLPLLYGIINKPEL